MYTGLHVKYPLFLSDFNENLNLKRFSKKNIKVSNLMKIRAVGSRVAPQRQAAGQTQQC